MTKRTRFRARHPGVFFLDEHDLVGLEAYMRARGWLVVGESIRAATKAGHGNMNCTLRLETTERRVIMKQARPWVEQYDEIPAPSERALVEGRFYEAIGPHSVLQDRMPRLLGCDPEAKLLMLEDLGPTSDYTNLYAGHTLDPRDLDALVAFLGSLHRTFSNSEGDGRFANQAMRELNHLHIFEFPLDSENGLDLNAINPGLSEAAAELRRDADYTKAVSALGELYLRSPGTLVHGDFFPGSWLRTKNGPRVIDPEFSFVGPPEFDVGVMIAHLYLANQPIGLVQRALAAYADGLSVPQTGKSQELVSSFAGAEIMRRLIGIAQLPLVADLPRKRALLELSRTFLLSPATGCGSAPGRGGL